MQCTKCKSKILTTDKFCTECGNKGDTQDKTCTNPKCNRIELPDEALYCPDCGTKCESSESLSEATNEPNIEDKNQLKAPVNQIPNSVLHHSELERMRRRRIPMVAIIGLVLGILTIIAAVSQLTIGHKYDRYISWSVNSIQYGDCELAINYYSKAEELFNWLLFKERVSLDTDINECNYKTALNDGEMLFSELTLDLSDVETVKDAFEKALKYKKTDFLESRIIFCEKLITALESVSDEKWVSALDKYNDAMIYAKKNAISTQIISEIKSETVIILTPKAKIQEVTKEPNVYIDGKKGMIIHVKFETTFMKDRQGRATAWFYYADGEKLMDENDNYCTSGGQVSSGKDFQPRYKESVFNDLKIFMPYSELHLSSGSTDLKLRVGILCDQKQLA